MTSVSGRFVGFEVKDHERLQHLNTIRMSATTGATSYPSCGLCQTQCDLKVCNRCRSVWYCSVGHQREHYTQHKSFCKENAVATESGGGVGGLNSMGGAVNKKKKNKRHQQHQTNFSLDSSVLDEVMNLSSVSDFQMQLQGSGVGVGGGRRRRPLTDSSLEASSQSHQRSSLVQVCPDSQSFEEGGFTQEWFSRVMLSVVTDLNKYGVCVVDDFLGPERADHILGEVRDLHQRGVFCDGQVVSRNVQDHARGRIRGDKITWVTGGEPNCGCIGQLVSLVDKLVANANKHQDAGELAKYNIAWRTQAMVACYPGEGAHYVKHVDNPDGDGRCITAIYYINKDWRPEDGGVLRIYPEGSNQVAEITPVFDRMLFFWSDRRNPHEVLPANFTSRYAITVWYFDQREREEYLSRRSRDMANT